MTTAVFNDFESLELMEVLSCLEIETKEKLAVEEYIVNLMDFFINEGLESDNYKRLKSDLDRVSKEIGVLLSVRRSIEDIYFFELNLNEPNKVELKDPLEDEVELTESVVNLYQIAVVEVSERLHRVGYVLGSKCFLIDVLNYDLKSWELNFNDFPGYEIQPFAGNTYELTCHWEQ